MTDAAIRQRRLQNHRLSGPPCGAPEETVAWLTAVQAQDYAGAKWALALRTHGIRDDDVDAAFNAGRILRTHVMRPTWHFVSPRDIRWLLAVTAPRVHTANRSQHRMLEITPAELKTSRRVLEAELRDSRFRTREEIGAAFARRGLVARGLRLAYLMMHAELEGLVCSGPRRGKQFTYALLDERAPQARTLSTDEALGELAERYIESHGPATLRDFSWWSGLTLKDVKRGVEIAGDRVTTVTAGDLTLWMPATGARRPAAAAPPLLLLPNYDEYFIAYKDRSSFVGLPGPSAGAATRASAVFAYVMAVDGAFGGTWRRTAGTNGITIDVRAQRPFPLQTARAMAREVKRLSAFLGVTVTLAPE